jgi:hypothetical protein
MCCGRRKAKVSRLKALSRPGIAREKTYIVETMVKKPH